MEYNQDIDRQLDDYSACFDLYVEQGKLPPKYDDDPIADYMKRQMDFYRYYWTDEDIMELLREGLLDFFRRILPDFLRIQENFRQEMALMARFFDADMDAKRAQWPQVKSWLSFRYAPAEFNVDGYARQFGTGGKTNSQIFEAMKANWQQAAEQKKRSQQQSLLYDNPLSRQQDIKHRIGIGKKDYEERKKIKQVALRYPQLTEIIRRIGREQEADETEQDATLSSPIPILLRHAKTRQEVDGVTTGNDLSALLPLEYALMDEPVFYKKYASKELQQFASKPPTENRVKSEKATERKPRLDKGPIILAIDTSGSMSGQPMEIAKSLLMQIVTVARRQRRSCFLITFAVRAHYLDLSRPSQFRQVEAFFNHHFTGGTSGEDMLQAAFKALEGKTYSMADVLVISDFQFNLPQKATAHRLKQEQAKGTRFYGLRIGRYKSGYEQVLDKMWTI